MPRPARQLPQMSIRQSSRNLILGSYQPAVFAWFTRASLRPPVPPASPVKFHGGQFCFGLCLSNSPPLVSVREISVLIPVAPAFRRASD